MIKDILQFFDIKLFSLANYLEISIDRMKSLNAGRRSFKSEEIMQLHTLHKALDLETPTEDLPNIQLFKDSLEEKITIPLNRIIQRQIRIVRKKERRLAYCNDKFCNLKRGLVTSQKLLKQASSNAHHESWLNLCERHLEQKLEEVECEMILLKSQIKALKLHNELLTEEMNKRGTQQN